MAFELQDDGFYHVPIVALGERLRDNFGLTIKEHSHFDPVDPVHSKNSYHYYDEAIDVQDWRDDVIDGVGWQKRTSNLRDLLKGSGAEVIGPGDMSGHDSHLHLAAKGGIFKLNEDQYAHIFGGNAGGRSATFAPMTTTPAPKNTTPTTPQKEAVERAQNYATMSKAELNAAYDAMRNDPEKARIEGMKMHKAFFNK